MEVNDNRSISLFKDCKNIIYILLSLPYTRKGMQKTKIINTC